MNRYQAVICAINAIGQDDRHYTLFMLQNGEVVARRHGKQGQRKLSRRVIRGRWFVHSELRTEETLRYIAYLKGFVAL